MFNLPQADRGPHRREPPREVKRVFQKKRQANGAARGEEGAVGAEQGGGGANARCHWFHRSRSARSGCALSLPFIGARACSCARGARVEGGCGGTGASARPRNTQGTV